MSARTREKLAARIARQAETDPAARVIAWVYFTDRAGAEHDLADFARWRNAMPVRSLDRRARRGALRGLAASDLPVHEPYVRALVARGARLRGTSRWLNAASIEAPAGLATSLATLPFVARIEPVPVGSRQPRIGELEPVPAKELAPVRTDAGLDADRASPERATLAPGDSAYYGVAHWQLDMLQVPALHAQGLSGAGVLVCMIDTGFRLTHEALSGVDVLATRDFIGGDVIVDNEAGQDSVGQADHGTTTLACVAGSQPGRYTGAAFGATVALAKTEFVPSETPVEMDYWQFAAEWADSLGADVISSSLGYSTFDDTLDSYTYADLDGRTTVVTRAAAEAIRRGITVVNSAGNSGSSSWYYIVAPADADSLIAVGAVDSFNVRSSFSSHGPTADGRVKPDVTAMGRRVHTVSPGNDTSYVRASGTSLSCPLVAGVVALLLEANPTWGPFEVREALRETGLNHASPDNDIGWGLVQAADARSWIPSTIAVPSPSAGALALAVGPNPLPGGAALTIRFAAPPGSEARLDLFDVSGRRRAQLYRGMAAGSVALEWKSVDEHGTALPAGVYWVRLQAHRAAGQTGEESARIVLLP